MREIFTRGVPAQRHIDVRPGVCRKRTKRELKRLPALEQGDMAVGRDAVRRAWINARCRSCLACLPV